VPSHKQVIDALSDRPSVFAWIPVELIVSQISQDILSLNLDRSKLPMKVL